MPDIHCSIIEWHISTVVEDTVSLCDLCEEKPMNSNFNQ